MKKGIAILLTMAMVFTLAGCSSSSSTESSEASTETAEKSEEEEKEEEQTDSEYVKEKGSLVVGITDFEPMDYKDDDGNWIGFDADMATKFAEKLGVDVEFVEIDWDNKILEINNKSIDCVWNGMTLTDEVTSAMDCSNAYSRNSQVVVVPKDKKDADITTLSFAVEAGSAGETAADDNGLDYTSVESQANALMEVAAGTSDGAIIDLLMADAMVGEGTSYEDLTQGEVLVDEEYGVGFRQGSDLVEQLNDFFVTCYTDGTMDELGEKYGIEDSSIIAQ